MSWAVSDKKHSALLLLIGLPGSGKSTLARQLVARGQCYQLVSTDAIRAQLFGDESIQGSWPLIWQQIGQQFQQAVDRGAIALYDATNAKQRDRQAVIQLAHQCGFPYIIGIWLDLPLSVCLKRNRQRDRQVPEEVIIQMYRQLIDAPPSLGDGFNGLIHYKGQ